MHYFQGFTEAKDPDRPDSNEDRLVAIPNRLFAVIDGATDLSGIRYNDRLGTAATGGHLAAQAVAEALAIHGAGAYQTLPDAAELTAKLNTAIADAYSRIGVPDEEIVSGRQRFRAAFAGAFVCGDKVRLIALGDCSLRINGKGVLEHHFPGDTVLAKARSVAWSQLVTRGLDTDAVRLIARQVIVQGLGSSIPLPAPLTEADRSTIIETVRADSQVLAACNNDLDLIDYILGAGLEGIRANPARFNAMVLDGVSDVSGFIRTMDLAKADIQTLEITSDGYPAIPDEVSLSAWEAALAHADEVDPDRIGDYASTKGRHGKNFGDDRTILIITAGKH